MDGGRTFERPVKAIEVQYAGQTHENDELKIWACHNPENEADAEFFTIMHDEKPILNCKVERI